MARDFFGESGYRELISLIRTAMSGKQNVIKGTAGQIIGFNSSGIPVAQSADSFKGPKGDTGTRGNRWNVGTGITGTETSGTVFNGSGITEALVDDMYLNSQTMGVYKCTTAGNESTAKWSYIGSIKGETGKIGPTGNTGATGPKGDAGVSVTKIEQTTTSTADSGENVITVTLSNNTTNTFKVKNGSKGSTGATGSKGDKGDTGTRGSIIHWGTTITGTSTTATAFSGSGISSALVNDLYINTSTWNVYQCTTAGAASVAKWKYIGNIKGATGATGSKGDTGATGATGAAGAKGATGATGTRGTRWTVGTAVTGTNTTGTVFSGTGITDALVNDMYLNSSTFNIYKCTTAGAAAVAKWAYVGCIKGATGATGAAGTNATTTAVASTSANGLMSSAMVTKLNGIAAGATADSEFTEAEIQAIWNEVFGS